MKHSRGRGRRRRSRTRIGGVVLRSVAFLALVAGCVAGVRWLNQPRSYSVSSGPSLKSTSAFPSSFPAPQVQARNRRLVYPYSIVPGGVASAEELRQAADHDPAVSEHYAGFNYQRARIVEVDQPKLVYLSYRRGNQIFWSSKQASLHKGEKLLTDGHITARTRCGNQVSVLPQANTSPQEPTMAELDRPDAVASGMERTFPSDFNSKLLDIDPGLPFGPLGPGNMFAGGPPPGGFMPMPIGGGGGTSGSITPTPNGCPPGSTSSSCNPPPPPPPPPPPTPVPEPGTFVLMISGAAAVLARMRHRKA